VQRLRGPRSGSQGTGVGEEKLYEVRCGQAGTGTSGTGQPWCPAARAAFLHRGEGTTTAAQACVPRGLLFGVYF
jgi:hypothetical protein